MNKVKTGIFIMLLALVAFGCAKQQGTESMTGLGLEGQDKDMIQTTIMSPEIEVQPMAAPVEPETVPSRIEPQPVEPQPVAQAEPSVDAEKNKQIQTALKNANFYMGEIDGKIGPMTRKAIEEFQKAKGLKADGKVGPMTWAELQKYLIAEPSAKNSAKKKR